MYSVSGQTADEAYRELVRLVKEHGEYQDGRDQATKEVTHVGVSIYDPCSKLVFARPINPAFAIAEVLWILSGSDDAKFISFWNKRMLRFAEEDGKFHGAYGYRLGHYPLMSVMAREALDVYNTGVLSQLVVAREHLLRDPDSRRAVLQIWDKFSDLHSETMIKDIPCNIMSHLLIRNGRLDWMQVMRSNDVVWGTPYNFFQWTTIQEIMAGWLGVLPGTFTLMIGSLHCYKRHWNELKEGSLDMATTPVDRYNRDDLSTGGEYYEWTTHFSDTLDAAIDLMNCEKPQDVKILLDRTRDIHPLYRNWIFVLAAERLRMMEDDEGALYAIQFANPYYRKSWLRWYAHKKGE